MSAEKDPLAAAFGAFPEFPDPEQRSPDAVHERQPPPILARVVDMLGDAEALFRGRHEDVYADEAAALAGEVAAWAEELRSSVLAVATADAARQSEGALCFHAAKGKRCTRYLEGSEGEQAEIAKWLRSLDQDAYLTSWLAAQIESGAHRTRRPNSAPPSGPCPGVWTSANASYSCTLRAGHDGMHSDGVTAWVHAGERPTSAMDAVVASVVDEARRRAEAAKLRGDPPPTAAEAMAVLDAMGESMRRTSEATDIAWDAFVAKYGPDLGPRGDALRVAFDAGRAAARTDYAIPGLGPDRPEDDVARDWLRERKVTGVYRFDQLTDLVMYAWEKAGIRK